jgi:transposase
MEVSDYAPPPEPEFAAFVALDWGDQKHCWALAPAGSDSLQTAELNNTPEDVALWATQLLQRFDGRPIAVALEQKRGAVVNLLMRHAHLTLYFVPPGMLASYRKAFFSSGAKGDPGDAALLFDLLTRHRDQLRRCQLDTDETRLLQMLVEDRRSNVDENTRAVLRLTDCLKQYFPQVRQWFGAVDIPLVLDLLEKWPDLRQLRSAHPGTLRRFFHQHNCRNQDRIRERMEQIQAAVDATVDGPILEACSRRALGLVKVLRVLQANIAELEKRIEELTDSHPDASLFRSFPGAGDATVPRMIAAWGTARERFNHAYQMLCLSGIAPVQKASGKTCVVTFRLPCPKFLRQTFHEFAGQSIPHCAWAKAFYQQQISHGVSHHTAVRKLAYKWIRILFRCWKDRQPYDEQRYLNSLRRRGALLGAAFGQPTAAGWQPVAGFQKFSADFT